MVNGNYVLYGDRPSSESEIVDDHVHSRNDRKTKRKNYRSANELQHTLNLAQLDNDTDSVKYEKRVKEPRLLRFVPNTDVEENFVTEKFETYDLKPTEERPRRYAFTKKPKNPADGSVNYAYSRSSSSCSSPNTNLPTISEHGEQHGMYQARTMASPKVNDLIAGYDTKLDKYFSKPRETKPFAFKGTHPDSLYRVPADGTADVSKVSRVLRMLRWPVALVAVCVALAVFVYFLMPDNLDSGSNGNGTYWEPVVAGVGLRGNQNSQNSDQKDGTNKLGTKTSEIDFYNAANDKSILDSITEANIKRKLPIPPVFPTHLTPEVQYGNEKADSEKRTPKLLDDVSLEDDTTVKPHITQKPEKPLAIYFKENNDATTATTETITRAETINDFSNYDQKQTSKKIEDIPAKTYPSAYKEYVVPAPKRYTIQTGQDLYTAEHDIIPESLYPPEDIYNRPNIGDSRPQFTSGHSKLFGISMEEAEKMSSTTQSALYNTRVSPTLPTWRDRDDSTTKKYPTNIYSDVQCRSTRSPLCRGVLPYDLAGAAAKVGDVEITALTAQIDYLVATNCSDRVRHFVCALMEPECSPPPFPPKLPCYNLCKSIVDSCDGHIPRELTPAFHCKKYSQINCVTARTPCYSREFTCGDGTCIPRDWICDGRNDCPTGEDEQRCVQCEPTDFKCPSGGCILKRWLCDGYMDCPEGEDENESICGARHVQVPADRHGDPGEESAGSAPAPAVRRPNKVPAPTRKRTEQHKHRENESSKELLMTSDSNAFHLLRNYTPSPSRLTPYNRTSIRRPHPSHPKPKKDESLEIAPEKPEPVRPSTKKTDKNTKLKVKIGTPNESPEDVNLEDLGLFEEFEKEEKPVERKATNHRARGSHKHRSFGVPAPNPPEVDEELPMEEELQEPKPKTTQKLNKASNQFEKVVDGAALLRKANAAEAAELAEMEREAQAEANNTYVEKDELPNGDFSAGKQGWGRAHTSPCPSGELRCVDGRCITLAQLCDGTIDCTDHADEDNCYT